MTVIVLAVCPPGLRGHLTRWMIEISPGVYVGNITARVRELMWERVIELCGRGRALMVHSVAGEQRLTFDAHNHAWKPVDFDGLTLMLRPPAIDSRVSTTVPGTAKPGWSAASKHRRFGGNRQP